MKDKYIVIPVEELRADQPRWFLHREAAEFDPRNLHVLSWNALSKGCTVLRHLPAPTHCIVKDDGPQQWMLSDKVKDFIKNQLDKMEDEIRKQVNREDEPRCNVLRRAREIDELRAEFGLPDKIRKVVKREQMSFVDSLNISKEG